MNRDGQKVRIEKLHFNEAKTMIVNDAFSSCFTKILPILRLFDISILFFKIIDKQLI